SSLSARGLWRAEVLSGGSLPHAKPVLEELGVGLRGGRRACGLGAFLDGFGKLLELLLRNAPRRGELSFETFFLVRLCLLQAFEERSSRLCRVRGASPEALDLRILLKPTRCGCGRIHLQRTLLEELLGRRLSSSFRVSARLRIRFRDLAPQACARQTEQPLGALGVPREEGGQARGDHASSVIPKGDLDQESSYDLRLVERTERPSGHDIGLRRLLARFVVIAL